MKRGPRRTRFPRKSWSTRFRHSGKGKGKGTRQRLGFLGDDSIIGPNSLAGGKGKGKGKGKEKGKGKFSKGNFLNSLDSSTGNPMRCHECGSTDHLVAHCPKRKGKGGKSKGATPRFLTQNERQAQQETILPGMFAQDHWFLDKNHTLQNKL